MSCPAPADQVSEENTVTPNAATPSQRSVGMPKESESDSVEFRPNNDDEEDWWLQVKKPNFSEPPPLPESLTGRVDPEQVRDSSLESPGFKESRRKTDVGAGVESAEYALVKQEYQRYLNEKWKPWAEE